MLSYQQRNKIALFLAVLFHVSGAIGILFSPYKNWFINNTPLNLLLMAALLVLTQRKKNVAFFGFIALCVAVGMATEIIGVNTGYLFGDYTYGGILGPKLYGVPWLIGINWFVIVFCSGIIIHRLNEWVYNKLGTTIQPSLYVKVFSFITDAALLTTFFDWIMEPAAQELGFWKWQPEGSIPTYNFFCWFIISALLLTVFRFLKFDKRNQFALHLFIIQVLFFLVLQTFL